MFKKICKRIKIVFLQVKLNVCKDGLIDIVLDWNKCLQEENGKLKDQIEKMKCGQNCKHSYLYQEDRKCKFTYCDCTNCKDKWEIKEND